MTDIHAVVEFEPTSGITKDNYVNTFNMTVLNGGTPGRYAHVVTQLVRFYNEPRHLATPLASYMSPEISRSVGHTIKLYDITGELDADPHGSPVWSSTFNLDPAAGGLPLPSETAAIVRYRAINWDDQPIEVPDGPDPGFEVDRPRQRYTGKNFIGPLNVNAVDTDAFGRCVPDSDFMQVLGQAGQNLAQELFDGASPDSTLLSVWSRSDALMRAIELVQVDNAFATIIGRGHQKTATLAFAV